ncbi:molybdenum cofactor biosynthesis protein MoaE [Craterilacuibacter sp.]|uniref:molybdenum cofactor biosynthesis protein MoaE n=1 Tax=Craterilacuibacter sp. TaxID=2870909 RepID=UPI003F2DB0D6
MWLDITVRKAAFVSAYEEERILAEAGDAGALVGFQGRVRGLDAELPLAALHLEHYPGVTEDEIARIAQEAATRWPLTACRIIHRVGRLGVGEGIVLVLVASAHREAAFAGAEFLMDYLKTRAPFWKREEFIDGSQSWVEAKASDETAAKRWDGNT